MRRQKLFRTPRLFDQGGDLSKPWWVEIGYRDPRDGKMVRKRYQDGFAQLRTKKERYKFGEELVNNLTAKLLKGWIPTDDTNKQVVYVDDLEYHQAAHQINRSYMLMIWSIIRQLRFTGVNEKQIRTSGSMPLNTLPFRKIQKQKRLMSRIVVSSGSLCPGLNVKN